MIKQIYKSSSPIFNEPNKSSSIETEALFGEKVKIINKKRDWEYCELLTDNYLGWIKTADLGENYFTTHRVLVSRTFAYSEPNIKSRPINYFSMGSKIKCKIFNKNWHKVSLNKNDKFETFIQTKDVVKKSHKVKDWVSSIEILKNTPYKWGGRDTIGLDCSSLIQLGLQTHRYKFPRNSSDQRKSCCKNVDINDISRGHLIFWDGHVGVMVDKKNILHANAHFMKVVIEPLKEVIKRIGVDKKFEIKKIL